VLLSIINMRRRKNPVPVYLFLMGGRAICHSLFFTVQLIYHVTVVGLDPLQMVLVGTVLETTCFLFEVPTGVVADVYSRRLSILIGVVLMGCSYTLEGGIPQFWAALVSQVFWGLGYTFNSGAIQAWITDEIGEEVVGPVFLRGEQLRLGGLLTGTLLSVPLGLIHIQLPLVLAGAGMFALAAALCLVMPETRMRVRPHVALSTFGRMKGTAREGFRLAMARPVVKVIIAISLFIGLAAEAFDRLHVPSVIDRFDFPTVFGTTSPVIWFGLSGVIGTLLGLAASELFKRRNAAALGPGTPARLLSVCAAVQVAALVIFAVSGDLWLAFAMLWVRTIVGAVSQPVESAWLNRNLDASSRATVISMTGQANSIGQAVGGPALGWIGSVLSIRVALLGSALILSPTIALYRRLIVRESALPNIIHTRSTNE
jgi:DHA3 family tetracycline resistance protein-like MFS transporter